MNLTVIPNTFSMGNLFFGFTSMLAALRGRFDLAAIFLFVSMVLDMFDGQIARMIKRDNPLGKELDSFADLLSFGIAPGVIFYAAFLGKHPIYQLEFLGNPANVSNMVHLTAGAVSFIFPLFATIRLARFNTMESSDWFTGCPSPMAGGLVIFLVAFRQIPGFFLDGFLAPLNFTVPWQLMLGLFLLLAVLMIVDIPFSKPQKRLYSRRMFRSPQGILLHLLIAVLFVLFFKFLMLLVGAVYIGSALLRGVLRSSKVAKQ